MTNVPHTARLLCNPHTLVDLLSQRGLHQPDRLAFTYLTEGATTEISLTYAELDEYARAIGALLHGIGAQGERVLLLYPPGLDYIAAFFGGLYAGATAVPGYPPRFHRSLERLQLMAADAQATAALTTTSLLAKTKQWFTWTPELSDLQWLATDQPDMSLANTWAPPVITSQTLALLQYTSGSTNLPKGVMLNHENLLHNARQTERILEALGRQFGCGLAAAPPRHGAHRWCTATALRRLSVCPDVADVIFAATDPMARGHFYPSGNNQWRTQFCL